MISIIIPVHNVEFYLRQCLDSLFDHNFGPKTEVILVNDGSTDESLAICKEYQELYPDTIVINKKNGGLSDARNVGIKAATRKYCFFLDSDDWLASGAIANLLNFAESNSCDMVVGGFYYAYEDHLLYERSGLFSDAPFVLNRYQAMKALIDQSFLKNFAWGKLYRTDIVKTHFFRCGVFFEDSFWQHLMIDSCSLIGVIPKPLYFYRQRSDSISGQFSLRNLDLLKGYEERLIFIKENYPELYHHMASSYRLLVSSFIRISKNRLNAHDSNAFVSYGEERGIMPESTIHWLYKRIQSTFLNRKSITIPLIDE